MDLSQALRDFVIEIVDEKLEIARIRKKPARRYLSAAKHSLKKDAAKQRIRADAKSLLEIFENMPPEERKRPRTYDELHGLLPRLRAGKAIYAVMKELRGKFEVQRFEGKGNLYVCLF